jgi:hypothetical protein
MLVNMSPITYSDDDAARALIKVIGDCRWEAVAIAKGYAARAGGSSEEVAAKAIFECRTHTQKRSREIISQLSQKTFLDMLTPRERTGSAENPVTKLFPATITEKRFLHLLDDLREKRDSVSYSDDRETGHKLMDFTLRENSEELPINIKNAGTRFERAADLVGLDPSDCIPIPAYKAHAAVDSLPNLLYVVSVDYDLIGNLNTLLPKMLSRDEVIVWDLLNRYAGTMVRSAEDAFIGEMVDKYWEHIEKIVQNNPFHAISARKAIRILQTLPHRTPGIGLRAWGTGASAEVNVHVSIKEDTTPWAEVRDRIISKGISDIIMAVNRKRVEEVYDPEI